jgi:DNA-binding transcriptional LysR family regulator
LSSVTIGAVLGLDPTLVCAVRSEHARDEVARGGVRRLAVQPDVPLPPLGLFTRRSGIETSPVVQAFAQAIRAAGGTSPEASIAPGPTRRHPPQRRGGER